MTYEEILEKLKNDEFVDIRGIWSFFGKSSNCAAGCCDMTYDTIEEAAEMAAYFNR